MACFRLLHDDDDDDVLCFNVSICLGGPVAILEVCSISASFV